MVENLKFWKLRSVLKPERTFFEGRLDKVRSGFSTERSQVRSGYVLCSGYVLVLVRSQYSRSFCDGFVDLD